jgi:hypothetical protein
MLNITFPRTGTVNITFPLGFLEKYKIGPAIPPIAVGVVQPVEKKHIAFVKRCLPLIEQGRLLLRPPRIVMVKTGEKHWESFEVEPDTKDDAWIASREIQSLGTIPVRVETEWWRQTKRRPCSAVGATSL